MKKILTGVLLSLCLSWTSAALAEEVNISSDIGIYSQYLWRGQAQGAGVGTAGQASVQGDIYLDLNGIELGTWFATLGNPNSSTVEFDFSAIYSNNVSDGLNVSLGYLWYTFSNRGVAASAAASNTTEIFGELAYEDYWSPSIAMYYDTKANDWWFDFGLSGELMNDFVVDFTLSYQKFKLTAIQSPIAGGKSEFKAFDISLKKDIEVNDISVSPSFTMSMPMGERKNIANQTIEFVFGVNFAY
ncbi:MAG: TorF family putative porin [Mariprofundaceae bacterium]|nr:TorF family putative porin [Mariprofundaceae bacterium]